MKKILIFVCFLAFISFHSISVLAISPIEVSEVTIDHPTEEISEPYPYTNPTIIFYHTSSLNQEANKFIINNRKNLAIIFGITLFIFIFIGFKQYTSLKNNFRN